MVNPETAHKLFQPLQIIYTEFIRGRVDTKKLGDVVAIRPEFFKDRLQEHINVDLLKEQIEIYHLGLPIASKQAQEFIILYYYFLSIPYWPLTFVVTGVLMLSL